MRYNFHTVQWTHLHGHVYVVTNTQLKHTSGPAGFLVLERTHFDLHALKTGLTACGEWIGEKQRREWPGILRPVIRSQWPLWVGWGDLGCVDAPESTQVSQLTTSFPPSFLALGHRGIQQPGLSDSGGGGICSFCHQTHCWKAEANSSLWTSSFLTSGVSC